MFYVYIYFDPDTKQPFYVGKGTGLRYNAHLCPLNQLAQQPAPYELTLEARML